MKCTLILAILSSLILSGCVTMMTAEQHQTFAQDWVTLDLCTKSGLLPTSLAAEAKQLYRFRLQNYKFERDTMNFHMNSYHQQIRRNLNPAMCNSYATKVYTEILQRQQAERDMAEFSQALNGVANAYTNSAYQSAQIHNQATQNIINIPQYQLQPVRPAQTTTNCMRVGNGMYNCQSQTR